MFCWVALVTRPGYKEAGSNQSSLDPSPAARCQARPQQAPRYPVVGLEAGAECCVFPQGSS